MEKKYAILIHQTNMHFLPSSFPAWFYGMPNGKVYILFGRSYWEEYNKFGIEYVLAEHKEFEYDYDQHCVYKNDNTFREKIARESVDKPQPEYDIKEIYRDVHDSFQAFLKVNLRAKQLLLNPESTFIFNEHLADNNTFIV